MLHGSQSSYPVAANRHYSLVASPTAWSMAVNVSSLSLELSVLRVKFGEKNHGGFYKAAGGGS